LYIDNEKEEGKEKSKDKFQLVVNGANIDAYMHQFQWDEAKYKVSSPLSDIIDSIIVNVTRLDEELRAKSSAFQGVTQSILSEKRKKNR